MFYRRRAYSSTGVIVDWEDIENKPETFPPTLPIQITDVTDLFDQLAALEATNDARNILIAALQAAIADLEDRIEALEAA